MRKRIPLNERKLPAYTTGEEIMNMVTHIVGGAMGICVLTLCVIKACLDGEPLTIIGLINLVIPLFHRTQQC